MPAARRNSGVAGGRGEEQAPHPGFNRTSGAGPGRAPAALCRGRLLRCCSASAHAPAASPGGSGVLWWRRWEERRREAAACWASPASTRCGAAAMLKISFLLSSVHRIADHGFLPTRILLSLNLAIAFPTYVFKDYNYPARILIKEHFITHCNETKMFVFSSTMK